MSLNPIITCASTINRKHSLPSHWEKLLTEFVFYHGMSVSCGKKSKSEAFFRSFWRVPNILPGNYLGSSPGVAVDQVRLELLHLVLRGPRQRAGVDLVDGVVAQVGCQLHDDGTPAWAALRHQHSVGSFVGGGDGPREAAHLLYDRLNENTACYVESLLKSNLE